jgi:hypothetical protein
MVQTHSWHHWETYKNVANSGHGSRNKKDDLTNMVGWRTPGLASIYASSNFQDMQTLLFDDFLNISTVKYTYVSVLGETLTATDKDNLVYYKFAALRDIKGNPN